MTGEKQQILKSITKKYQDCINLQGIAIDEPDRLERMHNRHNNVSLLEKYGYTETMAKELCEKYGLLSPIYSKNGGSPRDGCWFCPNCRISQFALIKINYPNLWKELRKLSQEKNLATWSFSYGRSFEDVDKQVDKYINQPKQYSLFD